MSPFRCLFRPARKASATAEACRMSASSGCQGSGKFPSSDIELPFRSTSSPSCSFEPPRIVGGRPPRSTHRSRVRRSARHGPRRIYGLGRRDVHRRTIISIAWRPASRARSWCEAVHHADGYCANQKRTKEQFMTDREDSSKRNTLFDARPRLSRAGRLPRSTSDAPTFASRLRQWVAVTELEEVAPRVIRRTRGRRRRARRSARQRARRVSTRQEAVSTCASDVVAAAMTCFPIESVQRHFVITEMPLTRRQDDPKFASAAFTRTTA